MAMFWLRVWVELFSQHLFISFTNSQIAGYKLLIQGVILWVVFSLKMEVARSSWNIGVIPHHYRVSEPGRPELESPLLWKPQSHIKVAFSDQIAKHSETLLLASSWYCTTVFRDSHMLYKPFILVSILLLPFWCSSLISLVSRYHLNGNWLHSWGCVAYSFWRGLWQALCMIGTIK
jgi:hypothetical protein